MKLYGIRFAKGFQYGTKETVFRTWKGNGELIPDSSVLYFQIGNDIYCFTGDESYLCDNMEHNIPIGISFCREKNEMFIQKAHAKGWISLPFHDAGILKKYDRLAENIVRIF